jgi:hypothetical protein
MLKDTAKESSVQFIDIVAGILSWSDDATRPIPTVSARKYNNPRVSGILI